MVDNLDQTERADRELNVVKRARFNQTIETNKTNEVPEPKFGVKPHTVKELPALPVRERQQDNMLLNQQIQDNMLEEEVVSFGQRAQQQDQQQLQLRQHNISHNPVYPKQVMSPNRPNVAAPNQGGPPGPEALYQQNNLLQQEQMPKISAKGWLPMASFHEQLVDVNRKLGILEKEATRLQQAEIGGLKERCKKIEHESVRMDRKWPSVHEQLQKIPELERELRASDQKIANLERKLAERDGSPRANSSQLVEKVALMEKRLKEAGVSTEQSGEHELVKEIHRIQVWIQSLNGGWSSNTPPKDWKNPIPILENQCVQLQAQYEQVQAEIQRQAENQRIQFIRTQSSPVQSTRTQSVPIQSNGSQSKSHPMDSNPFGLNPMDSNQIGSIPMSSNSVGLDQISFNRDGFNAGSSNPNQSNTTDSSQMPSSGLSAARLNPDPASTSPFDQLDPLRTHPTSGSSLWDRNLDPQDKGDLASVVRKIENLNRYVTALEGKLVTRIEVCESDVAMASNQAIELSTQYNEVTRNLSLAIKQVHKLKAEWDEWNGEEDQLQDQEKSEEIFHDPAEQSTLLVPSMDQENQSSLQDRGLRSLIDLSPIQPQREIPTILPTLVGGIEDNQRNLSDGFPKTVLTMAALKGTRRLYVQDQTGFRIGRIVIIHDLFAAQIVAYGSIVIDRPVDRDYPIGSTVRELTPEDDHRVDSQGRTFINGSGNGSWRFRI